jgi:hypothetical protein
VLVEMASQLYSREEVAKKHNSEGAWIVIHNSVYDVTEFLNEVSIIPVLQYFIGVYCCFAFKVTCKIVVDFCMVSVCAISA